MKVERDFIFDPSLVLYLPLYKLDGASFISRDAYGHLCSVTGALWRPNGRYFDRVDDCITVPHHSAFNFGTGDFSIIVWAKATQERSTHRMLACKMTSGPNPTWYFRITTNGKLLFSEGDSPTWSSVEGTSIIDDDNWHFCAGVKDTTRGLAIVSVEGIEENTEAESGLSADNTDDILIGIHDSLTMDYGGLIGQVWVYSRALTPLEIQHNYLATKWRYR